ncbi:hypothetical protein [Streptomyces sp. NPDC096323]|uniref:hypothetical protein n=1 Tax=Streptomyces sp. NPDC096323 TaxID=3155822 RepID=UPI003323B1E8
MNWLRWGLRNQQPELFEDQVTSSQPGLDFTVAFRTEWQAPRSTPASRLPSGEASRTVRQLTERAAARHTVLRPAAAEQEINRLLAHSLPLRTDELEVSWACVNVSVAVEVRTYAEQITQARRELELDALARRQVQARMQFMHEEILHSPASARIYLMLENSARLGVLPPGLDVDGVVQEIQRWSPQSRWVVIAQLVHTFVDRLSEADADALLVTLRSLFHDFGEPDLAAQVPVPATPSSENSGS